MKPSAGTIRTRRSDYVIRKQADYGPHRWSIHFRVRHYSDPYVIARADTREQARAIVGLLMDVEEDRFLALLMDIRSGAADRRVQAHIAVIHDLLDRMKEGAA
jgi:hypothetical protein